LSGFVKKNKKMVQAGFEPRSPAWLLATLPIEPRSHLAVVVYCTYLTHFCTLQLFISCDARCLFLFLMVSVFSSRAADDAAAVVNASSESGIVTRYHVHVISVISLCSHCDKQIALLRHIFWTTNIVFCCHIRVKIK